MRSLRFCPRLIFRHVAEVALFDLFLMTYETLFPGWCIQAYPSDVGMYDPRVARPAFDAFAVFLVIDLKLAGP